MRRIAALGGASLMTLALAATATADAGSWIEEMSAPYVHPEAGSSTVSASRTGAGGLVMAKRVKAKLSLRMASDRSQFGSVSDVIVYSSHLANTGSKKLREPITVTDSLATDASCPGVGSVGNGDRALDPGETITCTGSYSVTRADLEAGSVTNTAVGHAVLGDGIVIDSDPDSVTVVYSGAPDPQPALRIAKSADMHSFDDAGTVIHYAFAVTNTGNVTLVGPLFVTDSLTSDEGCPAVGSLAPGATVTCTASYAVTQADLDAGYVQNHAVAHATFGERIVDSNRAEVVVGGAQHPGLALVKSANVASVDQVGDVIRYTFALTNTGNVSLSGPITVRDSLTSDESCQAIPSVGDGDGMLDPGETLGCTASYTVTQADLDARQIVNTATGTASADGRPVDSAPASVTVTVSIS